MNYKGKKRKFNLTAFKEWLKKTFCFHDWALMKPIPDHQGKPGEIYIIRMQMKCRKCGKTDVVTNIIHY